MSGREKQAPSSRGAVSQDRGKHASATQEAAAEDRGNRAPAPLRVALVGEYPVAEDAIHGGGIQSVTHVLAHALARRADVQCHVICTTRGVREPYRRVGSLHVHLLSRLPVPHLATCRFHDVPRLLRVIRTINPHIVHGQGQDRHGLAAVRSGLPTVVTPHGVIFVESGLQKRHALDPAGTIKKWLLDRTEREVFRRVPDMIIISRYLPAIYGSLLTARTHFIENPIEEEFFRIRRAPQSGRLLFAGTVVPRKRVHDLVGAIALLKQSAAGPAAARPQWHTSLQLRIAGPLVDRDSEAQIRGLIVEHGLEGCVTLTGPLSQNDLLEEYSRAQLLLLASREETAPQTIAQAMACGLPVVSSSVGGVPHMVRDGETALLFPLGDIQACADRIRRLMDDAPLREAMAERIRQEARVRFHPDSVADKTVAVYRGMLAAAPH